MLAVVQYPHLYSEELAIGYGVRCDDHGIVGSRDEVIVNTVDIEGPVLTRCRG
jgi:hypothetical protein